MLSVIIYKNVVNDVTISLYSSKYSGISLGKELNTNIENLKDLVGKVKEDMTMAEIETILGTAHFESKKSEYSTREKWVDKADRELGISFKDGKAFVIGTVYDY